MKRQDFCAVAEMNSETFKVRRRNGDLPFDADKSETLDGAKRRWTRYSVHDAARLVAATNLAASQGLTWAEACAVVRGPHIAAGGIGYGKTAIEVRGVHLARVEHADDGNHDPERCPRFTLLEGPLADIVTAAEAICRGYARAHPTMPPIHVASLVTADFSAAYRLAEARMRALDILSGLDDDPRGWPDEGDD